MEQKIVYAAYALISFAVLALVCHYLFELMPGAVASWEDILHQR